jgi:nicotinamidase-related amidase
LLRAIDHEEMQMTYEPLSPETTALLLVDHQTRVLEWVVKAPPREEVEANVLRLARAAAQLEMPLIFATSEEGQNGTLLPAVEDMHPRAYAGRIERRGVIDSLADPAVAEALTATGRRRLIMAGIGTEVCGVPPALHAHSDGYCVTFAADACGSPTALGQDVSLRRLDREGVTVATTAMVISELAGDYSIYSRIMRG